MTPTYYMLYSDQMIQGLQYSDSESSSEALSEYIIAPDMNTDSYDHILKILQNMNLFPSGEIVGTSNLVHLEK